LFADDKIVPGEAKVFTSQAEPAKLKTLMMEARVKAKDARMQFLGSLDARFG
jgi:hypothetical protein